MSPLVFVFDFRLVLNNQPKAKQVSGKCWIERRHHFYRRTPVNNCMMRAQRINMESGKPANFQYNFVAYSSLLTKLHQFCPVQLCFYASGWHDLFSVF